MYETSFTLEIVTPRKVIFQGKAVSIRVPGKQGGFQVLHAHAPLLASLEIGAMHVKNPEGSDTTYATSGGFVEVKKDRVVVVVESAEAASEIDIARAREAEKRAASRLHERPPGTEVERAELALTRALNRLAIASNG
jgi:F-type H+-transporting ATPase subunit epsilon